MLVLEMVAKNCPLRATWTSIIAPVFCSLVRAPLSSTDCLSSSFFSVWFPCASPSLAVLCFLLPYSRDSPSRCNCCCRYAPFSPPMSPSLLFLVALSKSAWWSSAYTRGSPTGQYMALSNQRPATSAYCHSSQGAEVGRCVPYRLACNCIMALQRGEDRVLAVRARRVNKSRGTQEYIT